MTGGEPKITLINPPKYWADSMLKAAKQNNLSLDVYFSPNLQTLEIPEQESKEVVSENINLAIFFFSAKTGISIENLDLFNQLRELYIASLVLVVDIENGSNLPVLNTGTFFADSLDYEDYLPIVEKTLEPMPTKYLPLYSENGDPIAILNLENSEIFDYSNQGLDNPKRYPATAEHLELVENFAFEYQERIEEFGDDGFKNGLFSIAHPLYGKELSNLGIRELVEFLVAFKNSN